MSAKVKADSEREATVIASVLQAQVGERLPDVLIKLLAYAPGSFQKPETGVVASAIRECSLDGTFGGWEEVFKAVTDDYKPEVRRLLSSGDALSLVLAGLEAESLLAEFGRNNTIQTALRAADDVCANPDAAPEILQKALRSIERRSQGSPGLTVRAPEEILQMEFSENDNLIGDRLLCLGQSLSILGAGGVGKSRLAMQLAVCVIVGKPFLNFKTNGQGTRWLFIQTENSCRRQHDDLSRLKAALGDDWKLVNSCLRLHTLEGERDGFVTLDNPDNLRSLERTIAVHKPDVLVLDPLSHFVIGDPNADRDMMLTVQAISRLARSGNPKRAVIVLHHALTGRAGLAKAGGYDRASFGRNSKVLQAWTRGQINVAQGSPDNNSQLVLTCGKCSDGKEFAPFAVTLNEDTMLYELNCHFDMDAWREDVGASSGSSGPKVDMDIVKKICALHHTKAAAAKAIMEETGCSRALVYRKLKQAEAGKLIVFKLV